MTPVEPFHVVAGTGSRSLQTAEPETKIAAMVKVTTALMDRAETYGPDLVVMSGMSEGFDKLMAVAVRRLNLRLWCAVPNRTYGDWYWRRNSLTGEDRSAEFERILAGAWRVTFVMEEVHGVTRSLHLNGLHANFVRNNYLVEQADEFLVWNPTSRGTAHCLETIKRAGKPYEVLSEGLLPV